LSRKNMANSGLRQSRVTNNPPEPPQRECDDVF
jgi:hypothetical protein